MMNTEISTNYQALDRMSVTSRRTSRRIVSRVRGTMHGQITRLVSPSGTGQLIKPFVFLDYGDSLPSGKAFAGIHPHSGIATLSLPIRGALEYEDTTGKSGIVPEGGLEWMKAGAGVWHDGRVVSDVPFQFYQLWLALPASEENAPPESQYISPEDVQSEGPVTVLLGQYGNARSLIRSPQGINYYHVRLKSGGHWRFQPPAGHTVTWLSLYEGELNTPEKITRGELVVFNESEQTLTLTAVGDTSFVFGSAIKHPYDLVTGYYSVHTSEQALEQGEAEIRRIGEQLRASGRLR